MILRPVVRDLIRPVLRVPGQRGGLSSPVAAMFAAAPDGAWYEQNLSAIYQDSAGTTAGALEQPEGLVLDRRFGAPPRRNRLTYSSQFGNAAWTRTNILSVTEQADGVGDLVVPNTTNGSHALQQNAASSGVDNAIVIRAKAGGYNWISVQVGASIVAYFNVGTGATGATASGFTSSIVSADDAAGYYDCTLAGVAANSNFLVFAAQANGVTNFAGDGTSGVYLARAQLEWNTTTPSAYQEVTTGSGGWVSGNHATQSTSASRPQSKQDASGFLYALFDGTDDYWTSAAGGGGTTGFFFCAAIHVLGGAGTARTIFSDAGTNTGYIVRLDASNALSLSAGNGAVGTGISTAATLPVGETHVVTAWDDGTNLNVQVDNGTVASVARPVVAAGSAGFTRFRANGASAEYLNAREYASAYAKNYSPDAALREAVKRYTGAKAGLSL